MPVFQPTYKDPKTEKQTKAATWWYDFTFAGKRIREPAKTKLKTLARMAEQRRHRELEEGFNGLSDNRDERIRTISPDFSSYFAPELAVRSKRQITKGIGNEEAVEWKTVC